MVVLFLLLLVVLVLDDELAHEQTEGIGIVQREEISMPEDHLRHNIVAHRGVHGRGEGHLERVHKVGRKHNGQVARIHSGHLGATAHGGQESQHEHQEIDVLFREFCEQNFDLFDPRSLGADFATLEFDNRIIECVGEEWHRKIQEESLQCGGHCVWTHIGEIHLLLRTTHVETIDKIINSFRGTRDSEDTLLGGTSFQHVFHTPHNHIRNAMRTLLTLQH
mmetsp:Transcript_51953/g.130458  ORF Transcript_51953/g.130458 Transcript_51953/m.130458 type:complete len:221 (+) Transcript_51953:418-1080(+)